MENNQSTKPVDNIGDRDPETWEVAKRRVSFRYHLASYIVVNAFLWAVWYFSGNNYDQGKFPWPVWPMAGWGVGLVFHYLGAYVFTKESSVEREYEKMMRNKK